MEGIRPDQIRAFVVVIQVIKYIDRQEYTQCLLCTSSVVMISHLRITQCPASQPVIALALPQCSPAHSQHTKSPPPQSSRSPSHCALTHRQRVRRRDQLGVHSVLVPRDREIWLLQLWLALRLTIMTFLCSCDKNSTYAIVNCARSSTYMKVQRTQAQAAHSPVSIQTNTVRVPPCMACGMACGMWCVVVDE